VVGRWLAGLRMLPTWQVPPPASCGKGCTPAACARYACTTPPTSTATCSNGLRLAPLGPPNSCRATRAWKVRNVAYHLCRELDYHRQPLTTLAHWRGRDLSPDCGTPVTAMPSRSRPRRIAHLMALYRAHAPSPATCTQAGDAFAGPSLALILDGR